MHFVENNIVRFKVFANDLFKEQVAELKTLSDSLLLSGKLARLKVFNARLDVFKQKLNDEMKEILRDAKAGVNGNYVELKNGLNAVYEEYLNEFLCSGFLKKES